MNDASVKFTNFKMYNTCVVCAKDAIGNSFISSEPLLSLHNRVIKEKRQSVLYFQPRGHRMHAACVDKLKNYFQTMDARNATTRNSNRPILTLKK